MFEAELEFSFFPRMWVRQFAVLESWVQKKTPALGRGFKYIIQ